MDDSEKLLPVIIPTWPTCKDCLSWSEDDLAVAGGELVHILTRKSSASHSGSAGHPQWHFVNLRVNLFRQDEWPDQSLSTITNFSIGEEQSNSQVVALSWSNAGLGMHRRSVLAVLTSNLVLSLWETDGNQGQYQRTSTINKELVPEVASKVTEHTQRALRIRSFKWLPSLETNNTNKWGIHYLTVADDNALMTILRIAKSDETRLGSWKFEVLLRINVKDYSPSNANLEAMSPLQKRLHEHSSISKLESTPWNHAKMYKTGSKAAKKATNLNEDILLLNIHVTRGFVVSSVQIAGTVSEDGQDCLLYEWTSLQADGFSFRNDDKGESVPHSDSATVISTIHTQSTLSEQYFEDILEPLRDDFDKAFQLHGYSRIRIWGHTTSTDGSTAVVCVTIHPSDMIEYTIPSAERSTLVFRSTGKQINEDALGEKSFLSIQEGILQSIQSLMSKVDQLESNIDKKLVSSYLNLANTILDSTSELRRSLEKTSDALRADDQRQPRQIERRDNSVDVVIKEPDGNIELCEICGASVAFTTDTGSGSCRSGHRFSRCQLSFLAIQEPGVSKYCSQCGKQFLNLVKLGPSPGPSFAQTVFDYFDVCPYCQAKFRG